MDAADYDQEVAKCWPRLAADLGREDVPDEVQGYVMRLGLVYDAITGGGDDSWRQLVDEAKVRLRKSREETGSATPPGRGDGEARGAPKEIEVQLSDYTRRRGEVFTELIGLDPEVRAFRSRLRKPACIPLSEEEEKEVADAYEGAKFPLSREEADAFKDVFGTSRGKLDRISRRLAQRYGWRVPQARRFVLTGQAPPPLRVAVYFAPSTRPDVPSTSRVIVTADAWAPPEEVADAFRTAQRHIRGGDARKLSGKALEVGRFVARQITEHGVRPSWRTLLGRWNREHPEWAYKNSHNAIKLAFERLMHPVYRRPEWKRRDSS